MKKVTASFYCRRRGSFDHEFLVDDESTDVEIKNNDRTRSLSYE